MKQRIQCKRTYWRFFSENVIYFIFIKMFKYITQVVKLAKGQVRAWIWEHKCMCGKEEIRHKSHRGQSLFEWLVILLLALTMYTLDALLLLFSHVLALIPENENKNGVRSNGSKLWLTYLIIMLHTRIYITKFQALFFFN